MLIWPPWALVPGVMLMLPRLAEPVTTPTTPPPPPTLWAISSGLLFAVLYVALLGVRPLITPDEPRYAAMAADMLASGQWLKLRMAGFTYYEKPPMGVWLIAASEGLFGHNAFAVRLPGALASLVSAIAAGVVANLLLAWLVLFGQGLWLGIPDGIRSDGGVLVSSVLTDQPAQIGRAHV